MNNETINIFSQSRLRQTLRGRNGLYLKTLWSATADTLQDSIWVSPPDTLTETELTNLEALALSCPYINGTAVYKARSIYSRYNAVTDYNDLYICNNVGLYKGNSNEEEELVIDPNLLARMNEESRIRIYPNPTNGQISIEYQLNNQEKGLLKFYDIYGREILSIDLKQEVNRVSATINDIAVGIYIYRYSINGNVIETGKLIKE